MNIHNLRGSWKHIIQSKRNSLSQARVGVEERDEDIGTFYNLAI